MATSVSSDHRCILTLIMIFFFCEIILVAEAMHFWDYMTRSEIFFFFSCYSILTETHTILNVDFINRHKLLSTAVH